MGSNSARGVHTAGNKREEEEGDDVFCRPESSLEVMISALHGSRRTALVLTMLSCVLSRSLCQVLAQGKLCPTFGSALRAFATSSPKCGEESGNGSHTAVLKCC